MLIWTKEVIKMEHYFKNEFCPKCKNNTLNISKSLYHHIEECTNENCDYIYEEYKEGYEEFLSKK